MKNTKCYTFYSYKGGSGRSTTAINTVKHLIGKLEASPQQPILIIDADLESAGLTYFFNMDKRICGRFMEAIHTTRILADTGSIRQGITFGKSVEKCRHISQCGGPGEDGKDIQRLIEKLFPGNNWEYFSDMQITRTERSMLKYVLEAFQAKSREDDPEVHKEKALLGSDENTTFGKSSLEEDYNEVAAYFDIKQFIPQLRAIHTDATMTEAEKVAAKRTALQNFLPPVSFVDVSDYFCCEVGTVRFLGVDVRYRDEQIARNGSDELISTLIYECGVHNYSAVVFDCGAGTQSSAHVLHEVSDVIVYCMRPSLQFLKGTVNNLTNYKSELVNAMQEKKAKASITGTKITNDTKRPVIVLPTAVPIGQDGPISTESFVSIENIARAFSTIVDDTFCTPETALCEVNLFKWREHILGTGSRSGGNGVISSILDSYASYGTMPDDAKRAYRTYELLAERLISNSW